MHMRPYHHGKTLNLYSWKIGYLAHECHLFLLNASVVNYLTRRSAVTSGVEFGGLPPGNKPEQAIPKGDVQHPCAIRDFQRC
jgi:hypothetical protein